jgi:OFA family oxalate/formate antiporter-like MFS transporter
LNTGKKWGYLVAGVVMLLFMGLIYGWSIFREPLNNVFTDWDKTQLSMPFTISIISFCTGGFVGGKLIQRLKSRIIILLSAVFVFAGFFLLYAVLNAENPSSSFVALNVLYGVLVGFGVGVSYNVILSSVTPWFPGRAGLASGILLFGFGVGSLVFAGFVTMLVANVGIFTTFAVLGVVVAAVLVAGSFFIKKPEAPPAQTPATAGKPEQASADAKEGNSPGEAKSAAPAKSDYTLTETLKTPTFWLLFTWNIALCACGLLVIGSAAPIAVSFGVPATLGLIVSVFNGCGRPINGTLYDKLGRMKAMLFCNCVMILAGAMLFLATVTGSAIFILIGLPLVGISYGGSPALLSATTGGFFGRKYFAVNFAAGTFCLAPAAIIGPIIAAKLQEGANGAYNTTFIMLLALSVVSLLLSLALTASARKAGME